ncbi:MAG: GAF domain-containing protein [Gemmobacter sp.]
MTDDAALLDRCRSAPDLYAALRDAMAETVGHRLFTLMAIDHARGEAARIYTSHPVEYPVGGRKPLGRMTGWGEVVLQGRRPWIGRTAEDIRWAFFDHQTIADLGCASCINVPVIDEAAEGGPRVIGTMNLLHEAGQYDAADAARAAPFAALLVAPFRDWARGT